MKINNYILTKNYNEYRKLEAFKKCNEFTLDTINYIKNNKIINKEDVSINADFIHWFNFLVDSVYIKELAETYNGLSNNQKRKLLSGAMLYTIKLAYKFDRTASVYNKTSKNYTEKTYSLCEKLSINDFLKNIGMILRGNITIK